jgi:VIT1/CCC1 family predicted Fe2+/Mn2+ transporter
MGRVETGSASLPDIAQPEIVVGLLASPGPASELTESLLPEIAGRLPDRLPGVRWRLEFVSDRLAEPPTDLSAIISAGRRMLLDRGWHLAVCVTDLPLQTARRPVIAHVSATHSVAVLSMPALGPVSVRKRTGETVLRLISHILGDIALAADTGQRRALTGVVTRRMRELGTRIEHGEHGVGFAARVVTGNIWLLLGMLRANRPWRLALRLMRVLAAAFAAGVFALVTADIWRLAYYLGPARLAVIAVGSVAAVIVTTMVTTGLWERSPHPAAREQVTLFNIVTAATVGLGVIVLYLALFIAMLASALLLVPGELLGIQLGHPADAADQIRLAWLATSIATLGGALGAALESQETVREAAYTYQPDTRLAAAPPEQATNP